MARLLNVILLILNNSISISADKYLMWHEIKQLFLDFHQKKHMKKLINIKFSGKSFPKRLSLNENNYLESRPAKLSRLQILRLVDSKATASQLKSIL